MMNSVETMKMKQTISATLASMLLAFGAGAQAGVVYDNGAPDLLGGNEMTAWIQAEDFTLASTTTLTDVHFWTIEDAASAGFSGSIEYAFYADAGGLPSPGAPAFEAGTGLTRVSTGNVVFGFDEYDYSFKVAPFTATGGTTYWLALHNGPIGNDSRAEVYWETTSANSSASGSEEILPRAGDGWSSPGAEHAFQLAAVPEPGTVALLALGLAGLGFVRRRQ